MSKVRKHVYIVFGTVTDGMNEMSLSREYNVLPDVKPNEAHPQVARDFISEMTEDHGEHFDITIECVYGPYHQIPAFPKVRTDWMNLADALDTVIDLAGQGKLTERQADTYELREQLADQEIAIQIIQQFRAMLGD